jgi:hypothetical protein
MMIVLGVILDAMEVDANRDSEGALTAEDHIPGCHQRGHQVGPVLGIRIVDGALLNPYPFE